MSDNANSPKAFTENEVIAAFNSAADDLLDRLGAGDDGARDLVNLVVNAGLYYLTNPNDATIDAAIVANYEPECDERDDDEEESEESEESEDEVVERVLGWAAACV